MPQEAGVISPSLKAKGDPADDEESLLDVLKIAPKEAKTFLRVRRGWNIKSAWGEEQEEERESRERNREHSERNAEAYRLARWAKYTAHPF